MAPMLNTPDSTFAERAKRLSLLLLDVDGVMTDGRLYFSEDGQESKAFSVLDGLGIKLLQRAGIRVGLISGRQTNLVVRRARALGLDPIIQGREDKWEALCEWQSTPGQSSSEPAIPLDNIGFMGDDWPDLTIMTRVGLALTPANAHPDVASRAHWQSKNRGGEGAVREACDAILKARHEYDQLLSAYLAPDAATRHHGES
ncbi:KdsC family phosphatase [Marinimicrobium sp. ARAG 43.8]|uniref:KdsC family phosphatase n=1 Tax=Marinimicrobium sp. ARAG 43.8 TaxID=3418719 RepID=UPI003CFA5049